MNANLAHIAAMFYGQPHMVLPSYFACMSGYLKRRMASAADMTPHGYQLDGADKVFGAAMLHPSEGVVRTRAGAMVAGDLGVMHVIGALTHRGGLMGPDSGEMTSYVSIINMIADLRQFQNLTAVDIIFDSPGGTAMGVFEAAAAIRQLAAEITVTSHIENVAASAAFILAAASGRIMAPKTAIIGNIGVVMELHDETAKNEKEGVKVEYIYSGDHKLDGRPGVELTDAARAEFQRQSDDLYAVMTQTIADDLGLTVQAVIDTQARTFNGPDALARGLIHGIGTQANPANEGNKTVFKSKPTDTADAAAADQPITAQSVLTDHPAVAGELKAEGVKDGIASERTRCKAILGHANACANLPTAVALIDGGGSLESATVVLDTLNAPPVVPVMPSDAGTGFAAVMDKTGNPDVGPDDGTSSDDLTPSALGTALGKQFAASKGRMQ